MLSADPVRRVEYSYFNHNISVIDVDVVSEIEKVLSPYDLVSVVFLLYNVPETALDQLTVYQRLSQDIREGFNLLSRWAQRAQTRPTWRYEFLEVLSICQLFRIIRKLGFDLKNVKKHYQPDNLHFAAHVHPMKKALYILSEKMTSYNLNTLQNVLKTYNLDTSEHYFCEIVILELMKHNFIKIIDDKTKNALSTPCDVENLTKIVENLTGLENFAVELRTIQNKFNNAPKSKESISTNASVSSIEADDQSKTEEILTASDFEDIYKIINSLDTENITEHIKADTEMEHKEYYPIKNPKRLGLCCIINQDEFYPSKDSISRNVLANNLEKRLGSTKDQISLVKTMNSLNFEVISLRNVCHRRMFDFIDEITRDKVVSDDSVFILIIMSHGVRGHVYAADSVKVRIDAIEDRLDKAFQRRDLCKIPKVLILQSCQVDNVESFLVADSVMVTNHIPKSDFITFWATAPELKAYRDENEGSIFIQILCYLMKNKAKHEHLIDIFTQVIDGVAKICLKLKRHQLPTFHTTLRKKLYLSLPE